MTGAGVKYQVAGDRYQVTGDRYQVSAIKVTVTLLKGSRPRPESLKISKILPQPLLARGRFYCTGAERERPRAQIHVKT